MTSVAHHDAVVLTAITANTTVSIPAAYRITNISMENTTANAVTGGIKIGNTDGGTEVLVAEPVTANEVLEVAAADILIKLHSTSAATTLYIQAVSAWNSASLTIIVEYEPLYGETTDNLNQNPVATENTWIVKQSSGDWTGSAKYMTNVFSDDYAVDFRNALPSTEGVYINAAPVFTIQTGTAAGVTFSSQSYLGKQAKVRITSVTAGTYVLQCVAGKNTGGSVVADVTLVIQT